MKQTQNSCNMGRDYPLPSAPSTTGATTPDLRSYNIIALSTSGGKDSQAMMSHVMRKAREQGFNGEFVAIHSDLGRMEWGGTTELVRQQCRFYDIPLEVVRREKGDLLKQVEERGKWPSAKARFCTSDHKRSQIRKRYTHRSKGWRKDPLTTGTTLRILECVGIRAQESSSRAKKPPFEHNASASCGDRHVDTWLPIFHWTEKEVWGRIKEDGAPYHKAYDLGMPRLSCVFCIFAPESALLIAGEHNPDLLEEYVRVEARISHSFKSPKKSEKGLPLIEQKGSLAYIQAKLKGDEPEEEQALQFNPLF